MKTVLSVQDLSCVGRCSQTVVLPVLSAMGICCSVLPTAVLSTHTGFPGGKTVSMTDHIPEFAAHWAQLGVAFDAVLCGYLAGPDQVEAVLPLLQSCKEKGAKVILDPAMADHGKLYRGLDEEHVCAMAELCALADIVLPNVTEAALLCELPYREQTDGAYLRALTAGLMNGYHTEAVVITGVSSREGSLGFAGADRSEGAFVYQNAAVPRQFHGTGDLFSAVFTGAFLSGADVYTAGVRAADFVSLCAEHTARATPYGIEFEPWLHKLWEQD